MVALLRRAPQQMPAGGEIDRGHPLAQGLAWFVRPLNRNPANLAGQQTPWTFDPTGVATWSDAAGPYASPVGPSYYQIPGTTGPLQFYVGDITVPAVHTVAWYGAVAAFSTHATYITQLGSNRGFPNTSYLNFGTGVVGNQTKATFQCGDNAHSVNGSISCPTHTPLSIVGVAAPEASKLYVNGVADGTATANTITATGLGFGTSLPAYGDRTGNVWHGYHAVWHRALTPGDVAWLAAEPYAFLRSASRVRYARRVLATNVAVSHALASAALWTPAETTRDTAATASATPAPTTITIAEPAVTAEATTVGGADVSSIVSADRDVIAQALDGGGTLVTVTVDRTTTAIAATAVTTHTRIAQAATHVAVTQMWREPHVPIWREPHVPVWREPHVSIWREP